MRKQINSCKWCEASRDYVLRGWRLENGMYILSRAHRKNDPTLALELAFEQAVLSQAVKHPRVEVLP